MVKTAYTEETRLQPADFTQSAGLGASAWAQQFGNVQRKAEQEGTKEAQANAALDGMQEGLKGFDAKTAPNTSDVNRQYNNKLMTTASSVMMNQVATRAQQMFSEATKDGWNAESLHVFDQLTGAYGKKTEETMSPELKPFFRQAMISVKGKYDTMIAKQSFSQSIQKQKHTAATTVLNGITNLSNQAAEVPENDDSIRDINNGLDHINKSINQSNLPSSTKLGLQNKATVAIAHSLINNKVRNLYDSITQTSELDLPGGKNLVETLRKQLSVLSSDKGARLEAKRLIKLYPGLSSIPVDDLSDSLRKKTSLVYKHFASLNTQAGNSLDNIENLTDDGKIPSESQLLQLGQDQQYMTPKQRGRAVNQVNLGKAMTKLRADFISDHGKFADTLEKAYQGLYSNQKTINQGLYKYGVGLSKKLQNDPVAISNSTPSDLHQIQATLLKKHPENTADVNRVMALMQDPSLLTHPGTETPLTSQLRHEYFGALINAESQNGTDLHNQTPFTVGQITRFKNYLATKTMHEKIDILSDLYNKGFPDDTIIRQLVNNKAPNSTITAAVIAKNVDPNQRQREADNIQAYSELSDAMKSKYPKAKKAIDGDIFPNPALQSLRRSLPKTYYDVLKKLAKVDSYSKVVSGEDDGWFSSLSTSQEGFDARTDTLLKNHGLVAYDFITPDATVVVSEKLYHPGHPEVPISVDRIGLQKGLEGVQRKIETMKGIHIPRAYKARQDEYAHNVANGHWKSSSFDTLQWVSSDGAPVWHRKGAHWQKVEMSVLEIQNIGKSGSAPW